MKMVSKNLDFFYLITLSCCWFFLASCGSAEVSPLIISNEAQEEFPGEIPEYRVQAGDELDIKFFYNSELNERITVRPDGRISLQLINEIRVAGLTPSELTTVLKEKYTSQIASPEVSVIVKTFESHRVYVDGEVNKPGEIKLVPLMSVMQTIAVAGGLRRSALLKDVMIIRRNGGKPIVLNVNLNNIIQGDVEEDLVLQPYDIVYVPRTPINFINQWVREYVMNFVPYSFSAAYTF